MILIVLMLNLQHHLSPINTHMEDTTQDILVACLLEHTVSIEKPREAKLTDC